VKSIFIRGSVFRQLAEIGAKRKFGMHPHGKQMNRKRDTFDLSNEIVHDNFHFMTTVNVYLTFNGNCEEAFSFYKSVFGGEYPYIGRFKDMPPQEGKEMDSKDADKIMDKTFWGDYFGMFTDKFGINWMVSFKEEPK